MESLETMESMSIGRFSRLTGLTVKALRHYDELGLLPPAGVDPDTGYRSYSPAQVGRAEWIRTLRRLELPLDDISTLLASDDPTEVKRLLVDHQRRTAIRQPGATPSSAGPRWRRSQTRTTAPCSRPISPRSERRRVWGRPRRMLRWILQRVGSVGLKAL
jgi:DNA-binding transcriptional MerR regulator